MRAFVWGCAIGWPAICVLAVVFNRGCAICRQREEDAVRAAAEQLDENAVWDEFAAAVDRWRREFRETQ